MRPFKSIILFLAAGLILGISADSWADLAGSGSITYNTGLYAYGDNWANPGSSLSWNVTHLANGDYEYVYSFVLPADAHSISHVITQVSGNFTTADMLTGTTSGGQLGTWYNQGNSNTGIPAPLYGIKWDLSGTQSNWTIVTDLAPKLGNFYAKDGNGIYAYSGTSGAFGNNVVVPASTPTPVPPAVWLFGSGLIGLAGIRKKYAATLN